MSTMTRMTTTGSCLEPPAISQGPGSPSRPPGEPASMRCIPCGMGSLPINPLRDQSPAHTACQHLPQELSQHLELRNWFLRPGRPSPAQTRSQPRALATLGWREQNSPSYEPALLASLAPSQWVIGPPNTQASPLSHSPLLCFFLSSSCPHPTQPASDPRSYYQNHPSRVITWLLRRERRNQVPPQPLQCPCQHLHCGHFPHSGPLCPHPFFSLNRSSFPDVMLPRGLPQEYCSPENSKTLP